MADDKKDAAKGSESPEATKNEGDKEDKKADSAPKKEEAAPEDAAEAKGDTAKPSKASESKPGPESKEEKEEKPLVPPASPGMHHSTKILLWVLAIVIIAAIAVVVYLLVAPQTEDTETAATAETTAATTAVGAGGGAATKTTTTAATDSKVKNSAFEDQINGDMQLTAYLADTVNVVYNASECCGDLAKDKAATEITNRTQEYAPFDFTETNLMVDKIKTNLPEYADYSIGLAPVTDGGQLVLMYHLGTNGKVDKVFISLSDLLDIE